MSAPMGLEYKNAASPDALPVDAGSVHEGVIEALVAVTGVKDDVGDVIVPGAFSGTLKTRKPKVCLGHDWNRPIGKTLQIKELMPGDPALPKTTAEGKPWPREAGAVWAQFQTNMDIDDGKNAFHSAKFYGPESTYSIGYKATNAKHKAGTRYIHELDLFEFGPVLHPANRLATLQNIKSGEPEDIEYTDADLDEEKGVEVGELTLRDYAAILDIMEEKAVKIRRVSATGSGYWGLPVGTIIKPGMKPQGTGKGGTTNRGLTTAKPANDSDDSEADTPKPAAPKPQAETAKPTPSTQDDKPAPKSEANTAKPAETLEQVQALAEEFGMEVRPNPWPPVYIIKPPKGARDDSGRVMNFHSDTGRASASNGEVVPAGRVEDFLRTWDRLLQSDKDGYAPNPSWVLSEMDKPAREAAAKEESDRKKREAAANATDKDLVAQAEFEVDRLVQLDAHWAEARAQGHATDPRGTARARAYGLANLDIVNAELTKRGLPAYELPGSKLSTNPTGGRPIEEILSSIPETREGQAPRWSIQNGAEVLDDPTGSGVFAVGPAKDGKDRKGDWTITLGNGLSIPASAMVRAQSNESAINVSTPKKVTAWLTAMGALRGADGNPPPYGTATGPELLAWRDTDGRTLREALTDVVVPAYLKAIGKSGARSGDGGDKTKAANWRSNPALAATKLPSVMFSQFTDLGSNGKQAYILGRTEGDDHATALKRAKDMVANARSARESAETAQADLPTGPSFAPVNRTIATDDNGDVPTPEGEISTTRLLSLDRTTGPVAIAAMDTPELERHDAELTKRAADLGKPGVVSPAHQAIKDALRAKQDQQWREERAAAEAAESPERQRKRQIEEAPAKVADARRLGRMSRGEIALREANKEIPLGNVDGNAYNIMRGPDGTDGARADGVSSAELARGIAGGGEFLSRADTMDKVADLIDSWNVDLGEESDLPKRLRAWGAGARSALSSSAIAGDPEIGEFRRELAEQADDVDAARRSGTPTRALLAFALAQKRLGMEVNPAGYPPMNRDLTPEQTRAEAFERARGGLGSAYGAQQVEAALGEIDTWGVDFGKDQALMDNIKAWVEGDKAGRAERNRPAQAPKVTGVSMEDGRTLTPIDTRMGENQALGITSGDYTLRVYEQDGGNPGVPWGYEIVNNATGGRQRSEATYRSPGSALVRAEGEFQAAEQRSQVSKPDAPERTETITPELLDEAAESEAVSVGLTETPDGALEVDAEVADRQDRVEKLIKDADAGTFKIAEQSTEDLTSTRRDLVDELRLQTAIRRRTPRPAPAVTQTPKTRPGLAGATEDHAEALRAGDAAAIERTRTRLESSIRRSRVDSETARSLADTITSPDDNDPGQLSDLAKRLRAESRERRNTATRKRRAVKRIERERLQSLLGAVDTELRGRGVELEEVRPELLAADPESDGRPKLTDKMSALLLTADSAGRLDGHLNTVYGLIAHNLVKRGEGGRDFRLTPEGEAEVALRRDRKTESTAGPNVVLLNQDQTIENDIHQVYKELADGEEDWVRLSKVAQRLKLDPADWERVLTAMSKTGLVHLVPDSNTKVITDKDRAAAVRIGNEDKHLIAFDRDYVPVFETAP